MDLTLESSWRYKYFSGPISRTYQGHFGEVLTCKQNNGYNCSLVGLGNPKNLWTGNRKRSSLTVWVDYPEFLSSTKSQVEIRETGGWRMSSDNGERKNLLNKYQGISLRDALNADWWLNINVLLKKSWTIFGQKTGFWTFAAKRRTI